MLKDLLSTCVSTGQGKLELEQCLESVLRVIRSVNDSLHHVNIINLPTLLQPLGSLISQVWSMKSFKTENSLKIIFKDTFTVVTENKSQPQITFRNRPQARHVLLYENYIIFCRVQQSESSNICYQYKFSLPVRKAFKNIFFKNHACILGFVSTRTKTKFIVFFLKVIECYFNDNWPSIINKLDFSLNIRILKA